MINSLWNTSLTGYDSKRQHYLDNIRIFCTLTVLVYHGTRFFDADYWHVKNAVADTSLATWGFFLLEWFLCLFFFLAGASAFLSLRRRTYLQWLTGRFLRVFIPFFIGVFTLAPLQVYLGRVSHHQYQGGFIRWYPQYFHGFYLAGGNFAWMGLHLWFLLILFLFSLASLPLVGKLYTKIRN